MKNIFQTLLVFCFHTTAILSQTFIEGKVYHDTVPLANLKVFVNKQSTFTNEQGYFRINLQDNKNITLEINSLGFKPYSKKIQLPSQTQFFDIKLDKSITLNTIDEIVVTGTLKPVSRLESAVPVEVYKPSFFKKNPVSNIFEGLQNINGVRPQLNCNICNTGDIHINGLEGPYTLVLIDGMPIVSGLSTVYGLSGIPNALIEKIEIIKGPASSLYGSEAVGGLINIITKNPLTSTPFSIDTFTNSWGEINTDIGLKLQNKHFNVLTGVNYFNFSNPIDNNHDNFTDVTLQDRISIFQKWNIMRKNNKTFSLAARYVYEDRWGGETQWNKTYRGGNEVYGESIYTKRYELIGMYELPTIEKLKLNFSYTNHHQNAAYGTTAFIAQQNIAFAQLTWDKNYKNQDWLLGIASRYQYYNDTTPATQQPEKTIIPSLFLQDEITLNPKHKLLLGLRYDYNKNHGNIITPRFAYKWKPNQQTVLRLNAGTGFRVVNLFTEEHAALTGARKIIIPEKLLPEKSYNINLNLLQKKQLKNGSFISWENALWITHFTNTIIPDYETNPDQIIYNNIKGFARSIGYSTNLDLILGNGLKATLGATIMEVYKQENRIKKTQLLTEKFTATWSISYTVPKWHLSFDYTGNLYGPMKLPLLSDLDPRKPYSSTYSIQNIQCTITKLKNCEIYLGIKNLLNWTPNQGNPFIIARSNDPFDKDVQKNTNGQTIATPSNPYALTFDPSYVYGPNQGIRSFIGLRYTL